MPASTAINATPAGRKHTVRIRGIRLLAESIEAGGEEIPGVPFKEALYPLCARLFGSLTFTVRLHTLATSTWSTKGWSVPPRKRLCYVTFLKGYTTGRVDEFERVPPPGDAFRYLLFCEDGMVGERLLMASYQPGPAVLVYNDLPHEDPMGSDE